jgi:hypothetical protein
MHLNFVLEYIPKWWGTKLVATAKTSQVMLFREISGADCDKNTEKIHKIVGKLEIFNLLEKMHISTSGPRSVKT